MLELLNNLQRFILCAENLNSKGEDKKAFVLACLTSFIPESENKQLLISLMPSLIDFCVYLMNSPKVLSIKKKYSCTA